MLSLPGAPFSRYYAQEPADEGIIMETSVGVNEVKDENCPYVTNKGQIKVRIEWNESHLLFQATYHKYDDVCRIHNQQMRREIAALQAENYSLERQLFSYQKSLAYAQAQTVNFDPLLFLYTRFTRYCQLFFNARFLLLFTNLKS